MAKSPVFDKIQKVSQKVTWAISGQTLASLSRQQIELECCSHPLKT